jgi:AcrR family transcriptional regulator
MLIMQAVLRIANDEGWHALTMRKIAEHICYSPPMIYEVFENKGAIAGALVGDGYQLLYRHLSTAAAGLADPHKRLWALLRAFRSFAWDNRVYYEAMFGLTHLARSGAFLQGGDYAPACLGLLGDALLQGQSQGQGAPSTPALPPLKAARAVLAAAHGVIALHLSGLITSQSEADELYDHVLTGLLAGWGL